MSSITSTYPIHMLFESCNSCSFLGCIVSLVVFVLRENGFHQGTISTVLIYIYLVYLFNYQFFTDRYVLSSIMYSDGNCHLYSLDCLTLRDSCPFSSSGPIFFLFIISLSQLLINIFFSPSDSRRICLPCNSCCPPGFLLYKIGLLYTQYSRLLPGR